MEERRGGKERRERDRGKERRGRGEEFLQILVRTLNESHFHFLKALIIPVRYPAGNLSVLWIIMGDY